jgi:hypothetical protein
LKSFGENKPVTGSIFERIKAVTGGFINLKNKMIKTVKAV